MPSNANRRPVAQQAILRAIDDAPADEWTPLPIISARYAHARRPARPYASAHRTIHQAAQRLVALGTIEYMLRPYPALRPRVRRVVAGGVTAPSTQNQPTGHVRRLRTTA